MKLMHRFFPNFNEVLRRDLFSVLSSWIAFGLAIYVIENDYAFFSKNFEVWSYLLAAASGIPLFLAIRLWSRTHREKNILSAVGAVLLLGFLLLNLHERNDMGVYRWVQWIFLCHLLVALSPLRSLKQQEQTDTEVWRFNWHLLMRFLFGFGFCLVLLLGMLAALSVLKPLFGVVIPSEYYGYCWAFCIFIASVFQVLSTLTSTSAGMPSESVVRDLRRLISYLLTPLAIVYFALAYAYLVKIGLAREWPDGVLGWLMSFLTLCVFLSFVLQKPLPQGSLPAWMRKFWETSFALLILPLVVLLAALGKRIDAYGLTDDRVVLLLLGLWALAICFLYVRPSSVHRRDRMFLIPLTLAGLTLVTLVGPFSPHALGSWSQEQEFQAMLAEHQGKLQGGIYVWGKELTKKERTRVRSIARYFCEKHGYARLLEATGLPDSAQMKDLKTCDWLENSYDHIIRGLAVSPERDQEAQDEDGDGEKERPTTLHISETPSTIQIGDVKIRAVKLLNGSEGHVASDGTGDLRMEWRCCGTKIFWAPESGERIEIELEPLYTGQAKTLQIETPKGLLTLWLRDGSVKRFASGLVHDDELELVLVMTPKEGPPVQKIED